MSGKARSTDLSFYFDNSISSSKDLLVGDWQLSDELEVLEITKNDCECKLFLTIGKLLCSVSSKMAELDISV